MPEEYQKELFDEYNKGKSRLEAIADRITQKRKRFFIYVPLENLVVYAIIFIMCVLVAFALGVERGKRLTLTVKAAPSQVKLSPIEVGKQAPAPVKELGDKSAYVIQLMSFKNSQDAEKEKNKLMNKNIDAFIAHSEGRYQVHVGGYQNARDAETALEKFKRDYKGCFIRKGVR